MRENKQAIRSHSRTLLERLLTDEPTGNLDSGSGEEVLVILSECHAQGQTILMVTHYPPAAARAQEVLFLHDGQLAGGTPGDDVKAVAHQPTELT